MAPQGGPRARGQRGALEQSACPGSDPAAPCVTAGAAGPPAGRGQDHTTLLTAPGPRILAALAHPHNTNTTSYTTAGNSQIHRKQPGRGIQPPWTGLLAKRMQDSQLPPVENVLEFPDCPPAHTHRCLVQAEAGPVASTQGSFLRSGGLPHPATPSQPLSHILTGRTQAEQPSASRAPPPPPPCPQRGTPHPELATSCESCLSPAPPPPSSPAGPPPQGDRPGPTCHLPIWGWGVRRGALPGSAQVQKRWLLQPLFCFTQWEALFFQQNALLPERGGL